MKNILSRVIFAAVVLLGVASCNKEGEGAASESSLRSDFLELTDICVMVSNENTKSFDQSSEQIVYTTSRNFYMVSTMDYSTHYTLSLDGSLLLNNVINVTYTSSNIEGLESGELNMTLLKIDSSDKRYWLWDSSLRIGFVIDFEI